MNLGQIKDRLQDHLDSQLGYLKNNSHLWKYHRPEIELCRELIKGIEQHESQTTGLAHRPEDCPITTTVRNGMYSSDMEPTQDDVQNIVVAIEEDLPRWSWAVDGDHPINGRPYQEFRTPRAAIEHAKELKRLKFENITINGRPWKEE